MNLKMKALPAHFVLRGSLVVALFAVTPQLQALEPIDGDWVASEQPDAQGNCFAFTKRHVDEFRGEYATSIQWYRAGEQTGARLMLRWADRQLAGRTTADRVSAAVPRRAGADFSIRLRAYDADGTTTISDAVRMRTKQPAQGSGLIAYGDLPAGWMIDERHADRFDVIAGNSGTMIRRLDADGYYQSWVNTAHCMAIM